MPVSRRAAEEGEVMRKLRPTLRDSKECGLNYQQTYFRILQAVSTRRGLLHGILEDYRGRTCAVGAYFREANTPIDNVAIDEIAAYNDSFPKLSHHERWCKVISWLRMRVRAAP